jgi:hypothetical protein
VPLAATGERGADRLGEVHRDPGRGQLLGHYLAGTTDGTDMAKDIVNLEATGNQASGPEPVPTGL